MKCSCGAYATVNGQCLRCLHNNIVKASREHHMLSLGRPNWNPSHRAKWPETGIPTKGDFVSETIEE
jgi:hypothetical protein